MQVVKRNIKEGDKLANAKNITSSTPSETVSSSSGGIAPSERKTSSQVSLFYVTLQINMVFCL